MAIESLVAKIIGDARKASSQIERKAAEEVGSCKQMAEREAQRIMDNAKEKAARSAAERKQRVIAMAQLENRKEILKTKQRLIEEAFGRAMRNILSLDTEAYGAFLCKLILQANAEGDEEILLSERDRGRLGDGWIEGLNRRLLENKKKGQMKIAGETRPIQGGAILRLGRKEINCGLASVIDSKRNQLETIVAEILFKDID